MGGNCPDGTENDDHDSMDDDSPDPTVPPTPLPPVKNSIQSTQSVHGCFLSAQRETAADIADFPGTEKAV